MIGGGIVATMIYYGLKLLTPSLFLVSITVICSIVALAIGSSWSTMGTIGVAGMGIGLSMGIPAPMVAGAIISGSYFGDKMSPLSDTTNLAAGLTNTDLFAHIRHMLFTTVPGLIITLIVYAVLGRSFGANNIDAKSIDQTLQVLQQNFVISPFLLIIPVVVMVLVAKSPCYTSDSRRYYFRILITSLYSRWFCLSICRCTPSWICYRHWKQASRRTI